MDDCRRHPQGSRRLRLHRRRRSRRACHLRWTDRGALERKVSNAVARIKLGLQDSVTLGNLDSSRDWGYAGDYVEAMWRMLQQDEPGDYVIASGKTHTIRELLDAAFTAIDIDDWTPYVHTDERFVRPAEVDLLVGDARKAREVLEREPKVTFRTLVAMMVENDLRLESRSGS